MEDCIEPIPRALLQQLATHKPPKAMVLFGPHRAGKTTLIELAAASKKINWFNGDNFADIQRLNSASADGLHTLLAQGDILVIDEARASQTLAYCLSASQRSMQN